MKQDGYQIVCEALGGSVIQATNRMGKYLELSKKELRDMKAQNMFHRGIKNPRIQRLMKIMSPSHYMNQAKLNPSVAMA